MVWFKVTGFIDNTIITTSRPGGGPAAEGINAPRNNPLIQKSFYTGWKKLYGIKVQTVVLPNGMIFHISKAFSARRFDLFT